MNISERDFYNEGCQALRHYSNCIINVRTVTIAQGFIILSGAFFLLKENNFLLSLLTSCFGLIFTVFLHILQGNYGKHFEAILINVMLLEKQANIEKNYSGPWSAYYVPRNKRFNNKFYKYVIYYGAIFLLLISMSGVFAFSLVKLFL